MSNTPFTREEQYLSAIANGETNVPEPFTREEQYLYEIATNGTGGGSVQPDFILSGTCDSTPDATDIGGAVDNIVFNSTLSDMVTKATGTGGLDVGGCFTNGDLSTTGVTVFKSMIDYDLTVEVYPGSAFSEYGVTSDYAILLSLTTAISQASVKVGIAEFDGALACMVVPEGD